MTKIKDLDSQPAGQYAWFAARDAQRYSDECRMFYSAKKRSQIETFLGLVQLAYTQVRDEPTYRKRFAVIKIENGSIRDRKMAQEIDEICELRGYEKTRTAQGLNFRIPAGELTL